MSSTKWTRREFSKVIATVASAAAVAPAAVASPASARGLALVGSVPPSQSGAGAIQVFRTAGKQWTPLHTVAAAAPAHLLLHPVLPVLYAVHNVDTWDHVPRGAVSAYRLDRASGRLTHLHTQPLSMAATHPRHAMLTADASHLFVAAEGGGIYNLLPVSADGTLQPASVIRKEFGSEFGGVWKPSAPNSVALLPDGSLLAADAGQETLTNFVFEGGTLHPRGRTRVHAGSGPARLSLSADGRQAYTTDAVHGTTHRHRLVDGKAVETTQIRFPRSSSPVAVAGQYVEHVACAVLV